MAIGYAYDIWRMFFVVFLLKECAVVYFQLVISLCQSYDVYFQLAGIVPQLPFYFIRVFDSLSYVEVWVEFYFHWFGTLLS